MSWGWPLLISIRRYWANSAWLLHLTYIFLSRGLCPRRATCPFPSGTLFSLCGSDRADRARYVPSLTSLSSFSTRPEWWRQADNQSWISESLRGDFWQSCQEKYSPLFWEITSYKDFMFSVLPEAISQVYDGVSFENEDKQRWAKLRWSEAEMILHET